MYSNIMLIGQLHKDWKIRKINNFTLIENTIKVRRKVGGEIVFDYFRIKVWEELAEIVLQRTAKGSTVMVNGTPELHHYELEGIGRLAFAITARQFVYISYPQDQKKTDYVPENILQEIDSRVEGRRKYPQYEDLPNDEYWTDFTEDWHWI